jgi:hypothetical protein
MHKVGKHIVVTHHLWRRINRCVICGSKMTFAPSKRKDAKEPEGVMSCEQNHHRFMVEGRFDPAGEWYLSFLLPPRGKRYSA